jgi:hypothetical protein
VVRVVALDLPTSWMMATNAGDEFTGRIFEAVNSIMLDMLAAVARKDYNDRAVGRRKDRRRRRAATRAVPKMPSAMTASRACWPRVNPGDQSRAPLAAVAPPSPRSPRVSKRPRDAAGATVGAFDQQHRSKQPSRSQPVSRGPAPRGQPVSNTGCSNASDANVIASEPFRSKAAGWFVGAS